MIEVNYNKRNEKKIKSLLWVTANFCENLVHNDQLENLTSTDELFKDLTKEFKVLTMNSPKVKSAKQLLNFTCKILETLAPELPLENIISNKKLLVKLIKKFKNSRTVSIYNEQLLWATSKFIQRLILAPKNKEYINLIEKMKTLSLDNNMEILENNDNLKTIVENNLQIRKEFIIIDSQIIVQPLNIFSD